MARPLYQPSDSAIPTRAHDGHAGLWYDKFCDQWNTAPWSMQAGGGDDRQANPKLSWIDSLTRSELGDRSALEESTTRLIRLSLQTHGISLVFRSDSRFVTGLGRSHPVENGFAWHPTLGTPYLPGSSIKGMVHAWAKQEAAATKETDHQSVSEANQAKIDRLFGKAGQSGSVSFLDAVPIAPVSVEADVLTPHYAGWSPGDPPGDWRSPTPVPFLVTKEGLGLLFTLIPCPPTARPDQDQRAADLQQLQQDLELLKSWLIEALTWAGAGAKTAVGYGRFQLLKEKSEELRQAELQRQQAKQQAQQEAERIANLDPLDRELEELAAAEPTTNPPKPPYHAWIKAVVNDRWSEQPATARVVLIRIERAMREAGDWKEISQKKNPNKQSKNFLLTQKVKELIERNRLG